jgi:ATP-dependent DNA helicase RecG
MGEGEKNFDKELVKGFDFELEFDKQKLESFLRKADLPLDLVPEQALHLLGCGKLVDGEFLINNASLLFFAKEPQQRFPWIFIRCSRLKGTNFLDKQKIAGDLWSMVDEAMVFVKRNTRVAAKFDGFKRIDIEEYPYTAIREAIVNAVCHRDYCIENNVFVNIFDDRVEVISPGPIPNNLTVEQVRGKSIPRNRTILELFEKLGSDYVERTGTGFNRMDELMLVHGLKRPKYEATQAFVEVTFYGPGDKILELVRPSNETDLRELGLNERQIRALNHFQKSKQFSSIDYQKVLGAIERTAERDLKELIEKGLVSKKGVGKGTQYYF